MPIYCIIPSYNEEKNIKQTLYDVLPYVDKIIVIDDCSTDNSKKEIKEIKSEKIKLLEHPINLGQGAALQTGNEYALKNKADIIVHFDADGQFLADEINKLIEPLLKDNCDIVFGSRFLNIKSDLPIFKEKVIMPLARIFNYLFYKIKTSDPQSGFRAMNRKAVEKIIIENNRMAHCTEILAKAHKYKLKIKEVPIKVLYAEFGQKFSGGLKIIKDLLLKKISG